MGILLPTVMCIVCPKIDGMERDGYNADLDALLFQFDFHAVGICVFGQSHVLRFHGDVVDQHAGKPVCVRQGIKAAIVEQTELCMAGLLGILNGDAQIDLVAQTGQDRLHAQFLKYGLSPNNRPLIHHMPAAEVFDAGIDTDKVKITGGDGFLKSLETFDV